MIVLYSHKNKLTIFSCSSVCVLCYFLQCIPIALFITQYAIPLSFQLGWFYSWCKLCNCLQVFLMFHLTLSHPHQIFLMFLYEHMILFFLWQSTQAGYFTDLLVSDLEETQVAQPTSDPIIDDGPAAAKCSQGRSKNFSTEEDCLLVSAWLNVGMDPIQGVDQSQGTYWGRIYDYFHANKTFESTRTTVSLMNRWSGIQHDVNLFCGCVTRIQDRNRSGSRVDDKVYTLFQLYDHLS